MPGPLSARVPLEYTVGDGLHNPQTARRGRGIAPSFAHRSQSVVLSEPVTVNLTVPSMVANTSQVLSATQGLNTIAAVSLSKYDLARIIFVNVSASQVANGIVSHPTIQLVSAQGNPQIGELAPGQAYSNLQVQITATVYAAGAVSAGTLTVTAQAFLLGEAQGD